MVQHGGINPLKNPFKSKKTKFDIEIIAEAKKYIQENKTKLNYLNFKNQMKTKFGSELAEQLIERNKKEINNLFLMAAESQNRAKSSRFRSTTAYGKLPYGAEPYVPTNGVTSNPSGIPAEQHSLKMLIYRILDDNNKNTNNATVISIIKNNSDFRNYAEEQAKIRTNIVDSDSITPFKDLFGTDEDSFIKETLEEYKRNSQGGKKKSMKKKSMKKKSMKKRSMKKRSMKKRSMKKKSMKKRKTRKN